MTMLIMSPARSLRSHRFIQATCATSGDGLYEGLEWLSTNLKRRV